MSESASDKAIKKSSEDTSGFTNHRPSPRRLKTGETFNKYRKQVEEAVNIPSNYVACLVVDYVGYKDCWDHNLVNFYYDHEDDPRTTIIAYRAYTDGRVTPTYERP